MSNPRIDLRHSLSLLLQDIRDAQLLETFADELQKHSTVENERNYYFTVSLMERLDHIIKSLEDNADDMLMDHVCELIVVLNSTANKDTALIGLIAQLSRSPYANPALIKKYQEQVDKIARTLEAKRKEIEQHLELLKSQPRNPSLEERYKRYMNILDEIDRYSRLGFLYAKNLRQKFGEAFLAIDEASLQKSTESSQSPTSLRKKIHESNLLTKLNEQLAQNAKSSNIRKPLEKDKRILEFMLCTLDAMTAENSSLSDQEDSQHKANHLAAVLMSPGAVKSPELSNFASQFVEFADLRQMVQHKFHFPKITEAVSTILSFSSPFFASRHLQQLVKNKELFALYQEALNTMQRYQDLGPIVLAETRQKLHAIRAEMLARELFSTPDCAWTLQAPGRLISQPLPNANNTLSRMIIQSLRADLLPLEGLLTIHDDKLSDGSKVQRIVLDLEKLEKTIAFSAKLTLSFREKLDHYKKFLAPSENFTLISRPLYETSLLLDHLEIGRMHQEPSSIIMVDFTKIHDAIGTLSHPRASSSTISSSIKTESSSQSSPSEDTGEAKRHAITPESSLTQSSSVDIYSSLTNKLNKLLDQRRESVSEDPSSRHSSVSTTKTSPERETLATTHGFMQNVPFTHTQEKALSSKQQPSMANSFSRPLRALQTPQTQVTSFTAKQKLLDPEQVLGRLLAWAEIAKNALNGDYAFLKSLKPRRLKKLGALFSKKMSTLLLIKKINEVLKSGKDIEAQLTVIIDLLIQRITRFKNDNSKNLAAEIEKMNKGEQHEGTYMVIGILQHFFFDLIYPYQKSIPFIAQLAEKIRTEVNLPHNFPVRYDREFSQSQIYKNLRNSINLPLEQISESAVHLQKNK